MQIELTTYVRVLDLFEQFVLSIVKKQADCMHVGAFFFFSLNVVCLPLIFNVAKYEVCNVMQTP